MKSMKSHEIIRKHMKSMKIYEIAASWDRAKVSIGAGPRCNRGQLVLKHPTPEIHGIHENTMKSMKSHEIGKNNRNQ